MPPADSCETSKILCAGRSDPAGFGGVVDHFACAGKVIGGPRAVKHRATTSASPGLQPAKPIFARKVFEIDENIALLPRFETGGMHRRAF